MNIYTVVSIIVSVIKLVIHMKIGFGIILLMIFIKLQVLPLDMPTP